MAITVTDAAASRVKKFMDQRNSSIGLRLGVKTSGCSGYSYLLEFVDKAQDDDVSFEEKGVTFFVDPKSMTLLDGIELDFAREGLNEGFKFNNPNAKDTCGCGESFTV